MKAQGEEVIKDCNQENLDERVKWSSNGAAVGANTGPIATTGEVFADGSMIELIASNKHKMPQLWLWDGERETIGTRVEHCGQIYEPAPINRSILQELTLPTRYCPHGTTREFLAEICALIQNFVGLPEKSASLAARLSVAPALMIVGPDTARANRLS